MRIDVASSLASTAHQEAIDLVVERHEAACIRVMERLLRRFTREAVSRFERVQFAERPAWRFPVPNELLDETRAQAELDAEAKRFGAASATTASDHIAAQLGIQFDVSNRLLQGVIANQGGTRITTAPADLVTVLMRSLQESYDAGDSIPRASRKMRQAGYTHAKGYAERIARTEIIGMTNAASLAQVQGATTIPYKLWQSTGDNRTRPTHREADGQTVPIDSTFVVGGHRMSYPGDPAGPGEEVIQCRCTLGYTDEPVMNTIAGGTGMAIDTEALRARAHLATIAAEDVEGGDAAVGASWEGPLAQEGVDTGDGRRIEPGALGWRSLPLTLMGQKTTPEWGGHAEAQVSGRIDSVTRNGENINGAGVFDTGEWGADIERLVREKMLNGISVDLAVNEAEIIPDPDIDDEIEAWLLGTLNILDGTILGATIVPFPAFENAQIAIVASGRGRHGFRYETIEGERTKVITIFTPFQPALTASAATDDEPTIDDLVARVEFALDNLRRRVAER